MSTFGWIADTRDPPWAWDLRRLGWALCREDTAADRRHAVLLDARALSPWQRARAVRKHPRPSRLLALGVELTAERASLIELGCAEALSANIGLHELEKRARRAGETIPGRRTVGPLTPDLIHRDAQHGSRWLALHPREFGVLWRLAECPGRRVSRAQLLRDVWRLNHDPETNSIAVHVSRLRSKLA